MSSSSEPCVLLYAELLANIRQIRLFITAIGAAQNDPSASTPELSLSTSRSSVTVSHLNKILSLKLPRSVSEKSRDYLRASHSTSYSGEDEYSFRLPIDEAATLPNNTPSDLHGPQSPWSAKSMTQKTRICCRKCSAILFAPSQSKTVVWKDLPSADWAEMMDLWHCHKPDPIPEKDGGERPKDMNGHTKGYGATNRVVCEPGTIFVNVSSFVMAESDCQGVKRVNEKEAPLPDRPTDPPSQISSAVSLRCKSCSAPVGEEQISLQGLELFKANVSISRQAQSVPSTNIDTLLLESYPPEVIVGSQLLECIERSGARRFAIHGDTVASKRNDGLLVWVFNTDVRYSCNTGPSNGSRMVSAQRALKVFYQDVANVQSLVNPELGMPSAASLEELRLPLDIYDCIKGVLERSTGLLPPSGRKFKEWEVGLLDLFEGP
ncbi:hypothetical protein FQN49_007537 [Arthroderma sp. PD_2]|nr:hypothetical protein FQN49_007537 [Arthroderma sp. PD_2]